jgi:hypothetical protein
MWNFAPSTNNSPVISSTINKVKLKCWVIIFKISDFLPEAHLHENELFRLVMPELRIQLVYDKKVILDDPENGWFHFYVNWLIVYKFSLIKGLNLQSGILKILENWVFLKNGQIWVFLKRKKIVKSDQIVGKWEFLMHKDCLNLIKL